MSERFVIVTLAVNDENGMESGKVVAAHFSVGTKYDTPPVLELETGFVDDDDELDGPTCELVGMALTIGGDIGGETYFIRDFRFHVGNIFWNGYVMTLDDARRLASSLVEAHGFTADAWIEGQPFLSCVGRRRLVTRSETSHTGD